MSKMPYTDWKEWATKRPEGMREDLGPTFEKFVERKWQDALNVATAEPQPWGPEREKTTASKAAAEKASQGHKGTNKATGVVNVVNQQPSHRARSPTWETSNWTWRKCRVQPQTGYDGSHMALQCTRLRKLSLLLVLADFCPRCLARPPHAYKFFLEKCFGHGQKLEGLGHSKVFKKVKNFVSLF